ncbi:secretion-regulating guanine nucleotide exchange factor [Agrilus planipennis]|uniref:Secretion-regulating guanine nucleotide exchange factor n=1 Tax=Agrilus planipennis TaxID=224129 RepID=A0A1W4WKV9_AGRPL|nr:secretion-regulating guanine nucleotide exchange factor [Agrilus planipennis]
MKLIAWGANSYGQLGLGFKSEQEVEPKEVCLDKTELKVENIIQIAGGAGHTLILDNTGHVFSCGWNCKGQLGGSDDTLHFELIDILRGFKVSQISCGWDYSAAITECGKLFVWGNNTYTQLGLGKSITCTSIPTRLQVSQKLATGFKMVSCGLRHMAVTTKEDCVVVAGSGSKGQLGLGDNHTEDNYISVYKVPELESIASVVTGQHHTLALKSDGTLFGWGDNKYGQVGLDMKLTKVSKPAEILHDESIKSIHAGWTHSGLLTKTGDLLLWGRNSYGQLGMQRNELYQPEKLSALKDIAQVSMGSEHNLAVTKDGKLFSWGWNEHGSCGTGNTKDVLKPKQILTKFKVKYAAAGTGHSFAVIE